MKYTLYVWQSDNEGGYAICKTESFSQMLGYDPDSGWRAKPSITIGEFNTIDEGAHLLYRDGPGFYKNLNSARNDIIEMLRLIEDDEEIFQ